MPGRLIWRYMYPIVASCSLFLGLTASVATTVSSPPSRPMFAASEPSVTTVSLPDAAIVTWLGFASTAFIIIGKGYSDWRTRRRDENVADLKAYGLLIQEAQKDLARAVADLNSKTIEFNAQAKLLAEMKATASIKALQLNDLQASNNALQAQNINQAGELRTLLGKIDALSHNQNKVVHAVNKQGRRSKTNEARMTEIENVVSSGSGNEFPKPPPEDSTSVDLPTMP